ncbi:MAG: hypothetical protein K6E50_02535 [Lachnospiraceae bacterium]|nr:hypothetical protein [Lachnospiraceae bacterium]
MQLDFNEIIAKYGNRLYAAAFNVCRQPEDAEEYKVSEIAKILKQSENTVKTRLRNSRSMLRTKLEGWDDEPEIK